MLTAFIVLSLIISPLAAHAESALIGGGFAATGQIRNVGYTTELYDASNGLTPTVFWARRTDMSGSEDTRVSYAMTVLISPR